MPYATQGTRWTDAWHPGEQPVPPTETETSTRHMRTVYDKRQFKLDL